MLENYGLNEIMPNMLIMWNRKMDYIAVDVLSHSSRLWMLTTINMTRGINNLFLTFSISHYNGLYSIRLWVFFCILVDEKRKWQSHLHSFENGFSLSIQDCAFNTLVLYIYSIHASYIYKYNDAIKAKCKQRKPI